MDYETNSVTMQIEREAPARSNALEGASVVSKLVELGKRVEPNAKKTWMVNSLTCLEFGSRAPKHFLYKVPVDIERCTGYVAVSYPWTPSPGLEETTVGSYTVVDTRYQEWSSRPSKVRDVVLERVIKYAEAMRTWHIWIDGECIGQRESETKQSAMDSMDLVYGRSDYPVGLLAVILRTQGQLETLRALLSGQLLAGDGDLCPRLQAQCRGVHIHRVLKLLEWLSRDRWWSRAWIFQEEYLSSTRMHLLIRYRPELRAPTGLERVSNEISINASVFREHATLFLLAVRGAGTRAARGRCEDLLQVFGKYNMQYRYQSGFECRTMTSRILADIGRRGITKPYDILPIAANSCDYAKRLDSRKMKEEGHHVNLCVIAMCLANGELIRDPNTIRERPDNMDLEQCLQHVLFDCFLPPVLSRELSYLKTCRLRDVRLQRNGIRTSGHLWTVVEEINTGNLEKFPQTKRENGIIGLTNLERKYLASLSRFLEGKGVYSYLVSCLRDHLHRDLDARGEATFAMEHKNLMAGAVVAAMHNSEPLYLVQHSRSSLVSGVLTGLNGVNSQAFTSWWSGGDKGKVRCLRMSVEVEADRSRVPLLRAVRWVNGLVFFGGCEAGPVLFRWPEAWIRGNL